MRRLGDRLRRHESTRPASKVLEPEPRSEIGVATYREDIRVIGYRDMLSAEAWLKMTFANEDAELRLAGWSVVQNMGYLGNWLSKCGQSCAFFRDLMLYAH